MTTSLVTNYFWAAGYFEGELQREGMVPFQETSDNQIMEQSLNDMIVRTFCFLAVLHFRLWAPKPALLNVIMMFFLAAALSMMIDMPLMQ